MTTDAFSVFVRAPGEDFSLWCSVSYLAMAETIALRLQAERPTSQITIRKTA